MTSCGLLESQKTAKELNVPHNKLKHTCISNNIPLPTASYWSSLYLGKEKPTQPLLPSPSADPQIFIEEIKVKNTPPEKLMSLKNEKALESTTTNESTSSKKEILGQSEYFSYYNKDEQLLLTQIYNSLKVNKTLSSKPHKEIIKYRQKKKDYTPYYK